jgi:hypothetical protein
VPFSLCDVPGVRIYAHRPILTHIWMLRTPK